MTQLQRNILATLCYADIFSYPLKEQEVWRYFLGHKTTLSRFRLALSDLVKQKKIVSKNGLYALKNRIEIFDLRKTREVIARAKMQHAWRVGRLLSFIPTVWLVGVSGALAMRNAPREDDIDLFIITAPGTIWTTRFVTILLLDMLHLRRKPGENKYRNKICLNMYQDGGQLRLPQKEQDLYSAHEVVQLKVIVNKLQTYERFLQSNLWAKKFLPHTFTTVTTHFRKKSSQWGRALGGLERVLKALQLRYMQKKRTTEIVHDRLLRFHPTDARERVMGKYRERLRSTLKSLR